MGRTRRDIVLECTGFFTSKSAAEKHLTAGAKRVVISAPGGNDVPTIVYNTNHETLTGKRNSYLRVLHVLLTV